MVSSGEPKTMGPQHAVVLVKITKRLFRRADPDRYTAPHSPPIPHIPPHPPQAFTSINCVSDSTKRHCRFRFARCYPESHYIHFNIKSPSRVNKDTGLLIPQHPVILIVHTCQQQLIMLYMRLIKRTSDLFLMVSQSLQLAFLINAEKEICSDTEEFLFFGTCH